MDVGQRGGERRGGEQSRDGAIQNLGSAVSQRWGKLAADAQNTTVKEH